MSAKYVVITPVRNEEATLKFTIESMIQQSIRPIEWMIVNDGSTDNTGIIIEGYARRHEWIRAYHRADRGFRQSGGGVVEAFNDGYGALHCSDWDFVVKLDGDLSFGADYFERCFERFDRNPHLGIGGGSIYHIIGRKQYLEPVPRFHVRGATKIYRKACWKAIGGLWIAPGWDTFDEVKANRLGWTTESFVDLRLIHHRLTGSADGLLWGGLVKNGRANYICGYHPLFMLGKCGRRIATRPYIIGAVGLLYGYVSGYLKRIPQVDDPETIAYLRSQQLRRLARSQTIWR